MSAASFVAQPSNTTHRYLIQPSTTPMSWAGRKTQRIEIVNFRELIYSANDNSFVSIPALGSFSSMANQIETRLSRSISRQVITMDPDEREQSVRAKSDALEFASHSALWSPNEAYVNDCAIVVLNWKKADKTAMILLAGDGVATLSLAGRGSFHVQNTIDFDVSKDYAALDQEIRTFLR